MVEERKKLEPEVQKIFESIDKGRNFLLSGGAGSGKTYSLVSVIRQVISENPTRKVACMTYTNAAVKEIKDRVNHKNLNVSTIHDFLWENIKHFQKELKQALVSLANDEEERRITIVDTNPISTDFFDKLEYGIQYKEYLKIREGIISHDELLIVAEFLFEKHPKLCTIVKDKYRFIFIDEYQDTNKAVIEIFLTHFKNSPKENIIGFFGDSMQSIYDDGIGDIKDFIESDSYNIDEIQKLQNRRNPQNVIDLANKLRTDDLKQNHSTDSNAPNMLDGVVKRGEVLFLHSANDDINNVKSYLMEKHEWSFANPKETKELNLTHNLIAGKAGFKSLYDIYDGDHILNFKERIKKYIKSNDIQTDFSRNTFGEVIEILQNGKTGRELNAVTPTRTMQTFIDANQELYEKAKSINYIELSKIYVSKDQLLDDKKNDIDEEKKKGSKRDNLIKHLFKIQNSISFYQNKKYNEFLRSTDFRVKITSISKKEELKKNIEGLIYVEDKTIEEVINFANKTEICLIDDNLKNFVKVNGYLYNRVKDIKYSKFQKLYSYLEGYTPFSTQHKIKGTEFENVLVILENGGWNNYNFNNLFLESGTPSVLVRTQKIFYVCCTRTKNNLAVFYYEPNEDVLNKAKAWFGEDNVIPI